MPTVNHSNIVLKTVLSEGLSSSRVSVVLPRIRLLNTFVSPRKLEDSDILKNFGIIKTMKAQSAAWCIVVENMSENIPSAAFVLKH